MFGSRILQIAYLVAGLVVAANKGYFESLSNVEKIVEAGLAVLLWPLLLFDVSLRI